MRLHLQFTNQTGFVCRDLRLSGEWNMYVCVAVDKYFAPLTRSVRNVVRSQRTMNLHATQGYF